MTPMKMASDELDLLIHVNSFGDYFSCTICMETLTKTTMTPCGHRFCMACIEECLARRHKCPCCNETARIDDVILDPQFDQLIEMVDKQKQEAERKYYSELIDQNFNKDADGSVRKNLSPVELVLKKHLKHHLAVHENCYQDLRKKCNQKKAEIQLKHKEMVDSLEAQHVTEETKSRIADLNRKCEELKQEVEKDLEDATASIAEAYDSHLSKTIPSFDLLPIQVTFNVLCKNTSISGIKLNPHDTLENIKKILIEKMAERGDKILQFGADVKFLAFGPFAKHSQYEMLQLSSDIVENGAEYTDVVVIPEKSCPVLQFSLKPGSEISVYGKVQCESDLPKRCFSHTFQPDSGAATDYFSCKDCRINWVCRSCMEVCHKEHAVVPYILNHQPTWNCCYCPKKKKCVIQENS